MTSSSPDDRIRSVAASLAADVLGEAIQEARSEAIALLRDRLVAAIIDEVTGTREGRPAKAEAEAVEAEQRGYYMYGITWNQPGLRDGLSPGIDGGPVETVPAGAVAAIVSPIRARPGGWGVDDSGQADLETLTPKVVAHERVLEEVLDRAPVLPLRFGAMYRTKEEIAMIMDSNAATTVEALNRLAGQAEWGLVVDWQPSAGKDPDALSSPGGRDYLSLRRAERASIRHWEQLAHDTADRINLAAASVASDSVVRLTRISTGSSRARIVDASYLVPRTSDADFRQAIESALSSLPQELGVRGVLTGPWPPYNFCNPPREELLA